MKIKKLDSIRGVQLSAVMTIVVRSEVVQTGLFMTKFKGPTADGFPAERINLNAVGK